MPDSISHLPIIKGAGSFISHFTFALKVSRPGFWLTSAWFYMLPLGRQPVFGHAAFWIGAFYVTFPLGFLLYGWNDAVDFETDRMNPRKDTFLFGARGTQEQLSALPWRIVTVQLPFVALFYVLAGPKILAWFSAIVLATAFYNLPRFGAKGRAGLDLLNQSGYLLVFVLSSWLNHVAQIPWYSFVFGALFAMHSHLFGQIMDIVPDLRAGRRTTAGVLGIIPSKFLLAAFLASEGGLVRVYAHDPLMAGFLVMAAIWFLLDATVLWKNRMYTPGQMRFFLLSWNAAALITMPIVWRMGVLAGKP